MLADTPGLLRLDNDKARERIRHGAAAITPGRK